VYVNVPVCSITENQVCHECHIQMSSMVWMKDSCFSIRVYAVRVLEIVEGMF